MATWSHVIQAHAQQGFVVMTLVCMVLYNSGHDTLTKWWNPITYQLEKYEKTHACKEILRMYYCHQICEIKCPQNAHSYLWKQMHTHTYTHTSSAQAGLHWHHKTVVASWYFLTICPALLYNRSLWAPLMGHLLEKKDTRWVRLFYRKNVKSGCLAVAALRSHHQLDGKCQKSFGSQHHHSGTAGLHQTVRIDFLTWKKKDMKKMFSSHLQLFGCFISSQLICCCPVWGSYITFC